MKKLKIKVGEKTVSALFNEAGKPRGIYVLAHGAGAGMDHSFMKGVSESLKEKGISTLRFNFPYMEEGSKRPDRKPLAIATIRAALEKAQTLGKGPYVVGGKSFGGRMSAHAVAPDTSGASGILFLGFPLHPPKKEGTERGEILKELNIPMLFVQGTRDTLADLKLIKQVVKKLKSATLHIVEGGDHSFGVLKRSGRNPEEVQAELAETISHWWKETL